MTDDTIDELLFGQNVLPIERRKVRLEYSRDLTEADIAALATRAPVKPKSLVRIHASHHALARCLAAGMKHSHAALITGYTEPRISQLCADPAFQALVADYRLESKSVMADMTQRMTNISLDALELLQEKMHEAPQEMTISMLLDVVKTFADRTGHGPGQDVNIKMGVELVDRPPRETFEEWTKRRNAELLAEAERPHEGDNAPLIEGEKSKLN